jgi:phospholipid/cholesterol/gamma-HCH transport system ATP-binding protein
MTESIKNSDTSGSSAVVSIQNLDFAYALGERKILSGLNMEFRRGQVVAVMGGSGCGKTTVLRLIGGKSLHKADRFCLREKM